jgi:hypothetical protein
MGPEATMVMLRAFDMVYGRIEQPEMFMYGLTHLI